MMLEIDRIQDQLQRAYEGGAWHGPALLELLSDVTPEEALAKPLPGVHSIWEIVLHITAWKHVVRRRLSGEAVELTADEDWPPVEGCGEATWRAAQESLDTSYRELQEVISCLAESSLKQQVSGKSYSVYVMLHGLIQHDIYHAGQIAILKVGLGNRA